MLINNIIYFSRPFKIEHEIIYLGIPNQCFRCKKFNLMVYFCPIPNKGTKKQQLDWLRTRRCHHKKGHATTPMTNKRNV